MAGNPMVSWTIQHPERSLGPMCWPCIEAGSRLGGFVHVPAHRGPNAQGNLKRAAVWRVKRPDSHKGRKRMSTPKTIRNTNMTTEVQESDAEWRGGAHTPAI